MWDFSIVRSIEIVARTWPFTVLRLVVYVGVTLALLVATSVGAGLGWGIGHVGTVDFRHATTFWGGVVGIGGVSIWLWTLRDYLLYLLTAGHVAAMTMAFEGKPLPSGRDQITFALAAVRERFGEVHLLFVLDAAVKGAVGAVTRLLDWTAWLTGVPGLEGLVRIVGAVLRMSTTFLDELVLAREIRISSTDAWTTAREGVVLYAQNARLILKNAVWLTALRWVAWAVLAVVVAGPAALLVAIVPGSATAWALIFSLVLAVALQRALIDPFCIASLMQAWFTAIEDQDPDPAWDARLAEVSQPFRDLVERARGAFGEAPR